MEPAVHLFYSILVSIGAVTIFFAPFGLIFSYSCLKIVHFNLRILMFTLGLLWCILPIGATLFYFILDSEENPPDLYNKLLYQIAKNIVAITGYAIRLIETSICFERLLATVFFETYERKRIFRIYPFLSIAVTIFISASFSVLFNILHVPAGVIFVFLFTVETINFILIYILRKQNHKLRQMSNSERALLTSKYQLIENIKSLNLLFPQAIISFIIANTSITSSIIIGEVYEPFRTPLFFLIYCINVIVMSLHWTYRSTWFTFQLSTIQRSFLNQINDAPEVMSLKATFVKTALGQRVKAQQTIDEHFIDLKNLWE